MKPTTTWSHVPFKQYIPDTHEIYINRVAPFKTGVTFDFMLVGADFDVKEFDVHVRLRGSDDAWKTKKVSGFTATIDGLETDTDYEFYVSAGELSSLVRFVRPYEVPGKVLNYIHAQDPIYSFSGQYLSSPSILRTKKGTLIVSTDVFDDNTPQNLTFIYRSEDNGKTWQYACELLPCFWGELFEHNGEIYMFAVSGEYGDLLIGKSTDDGKSFSMPTVLYRGSNSRDVTGPHRNATQIIEHDGRIWASVESGGWTGDVPGHFFFTVASAPSDADLLDASNWVFSEPLKYDRNWPGAFPGATRGCIEGNMVVSPEGKLYNILRYETERHAKDYGKIPVLEVNTKDPEAQLKFAYFAKLDANKSKFEIQKDPVTGNYYTIANRIRNAECTRHRNLISLFVSKDLVTFEPVCDLIDITDLDPLMNGVQYCSFVFDGDDIQFVCRTGLGGSHSYHDTNYITHHVIKDFRNIK